VTVRPATKVEPLGLPGLLLLRGLRHHDERGFLRKVVVAATLRVHGVDLVVDEVVTTTNEVAGTVRGMHYQAPPHEEAKTLWVTNGALVDVLVDVRPDEPTYGRHVALRLDADDDLGLYVPPGVAHGYQTLADDTSLTYLVRGSYSPEHARTLAWDDPTVGVSWPLPVSRISEKDRQGHPWPQG
jgi:dTDP-4-dehydrorhamnose 3,5-epimerase